ncbi:hypothetical protein BT63DRAFT_10801 [Microthyrium microscopicum]|uniref:Uncharacterized protein n=1 Tax=Microthyrium microscopicum TaxID=703497 RepID=A0A6A6URT4_9PEZI|nr:hypothetical protein BT63DRAFT_10801 [Microthyrium microscopicum]
MIRTLAIAAASFAFSAYAQCQAASNFQMTFYAWPDNDPPSADTAMNCGGRNNVAGGTGTFDDPLTMAAEKGRFTNCQVVYAPYLKKYLRLEDTCAACTGDWVDVWTGPNNGDAGAGLSECELSLTGGDKADHPLVINPPNNLEVNSADLFSSGQCNTQHTFPTNVLANASSSILRGE